MLDEIEKQGDELQVVLPTTVEKTGVGEETDDMFKADFETYSLGNAGKSGLKAKECNKDLVCDLMMAKDTQYSEVKVINTFNPITPMRKKSMEGKASEKTINT